MGCRFASVRRGHRVCEFRRKCLFGCCPGTTTLILRPFFVSLSAMCMAEHSVEWATFCAGRSHHQCLHQNGMLKAEGSCPVACSLVRNHTLYLKASQELLQAPGVAQWPSGFRDHCKGGLVLLHAVWCVHGAADKLHVRPS